MKNPPEATKRDFVLRGTTADEESMKRRAAEDQRIRVPTILRNIADEFESRQQGSSPHGICADLPHPEFRPAPLRQARTLSSRLKFVLSQTFFHKLNAFRAINQAADEAAVPMHIWFELLERGYEDLYTAQRKVNTTWMMLLRLGEEPDISLYKPGPRTEEIMPVLDVCDLETLTDWDYRDRVARLIVARSVRQAMIKELENGVKRVQELVDDVHEDAPAVI